MANFSEYNQVGEKPGMLKTLKIILNPIALFFDIRLGSNGIEFIFLRFLVLATINYKNIDVVRRQTNLVTPLTAYRFVNRFGRRYVIYNNASWFSKYVVVSPDNGDEFEEQLRYFGVQVDG